jgi:hypothetical protein
MRFFAKFWEEGYIGVVKIFGGGYTFLCFIAFLLTSFAKNLEGGYTFIPLIPLPLPMCIYALECLDECTFVNSK